MATSIAPIQGRIRILTTSCELEAVRTAWARWHHHPNSDFDFYRTIINARSDIIAPFIIVVERNDRIEALLVGRLENRRVDFKVGYRIVASIKTRVLVFIHGGLLGVDSPDNAALMLSAIKDRLRAGAADMTEFSALRTDSRLYRYAKTQSTFLSLSQCGPSRPHWSITVPDTLPLFLSRLSPKTRRRRKHEANTLYRDFPGAVRIDCWSEETDVTTAIPHVEDIARRTYHRGLGVGFVANEENRRRLLHEATRGRLRMHVLYLNDRPSAFLIGTIYLDTYFPSFTGYDPHYQKYSLGTFLLLHVVGELCGAGVKRIDFGSGDAWYKEHFCDSEWDEASVHVFARSLRGVCLALLHSLTSLINVTAVKCLNRAGLLLKCKRLWRSHYAAAPSPTHIAHSR